MTKDAASAILCVILIIALCIFVDWLDSKNYDDRKVRIIFWIGFSCFIFAASLIP